MIVLPMAGLSSRFTKEGYDRPKYELPLKGRPVLDHVLSGFRSLWGVIPFTLIVRDEASKRFAESRVAALGIMNVQVVSINRATAGQAETVARGLKDVVIDPDEAITIFNIDTFRPRFDFPTSSGWFGGSDGYLEVFRGSGSNWSYVKPGDQANQVVLVKEKEQISQLCCTGLYHFSRSEAFMNCFEQEVHSPSQSELFVAPLYNHLIAAGGSVHYNLINGEDVQFCGTPAEYRALGGGPAPDGR